MTSVRWHSVYTAFQGTTQSHGIEWTEIAWSECQPRKLELLWYVVGATGGLKMRTTLPNACV
jgi:hypothetical protein